MEVMDLLAQYLVFMLLLFCVKYRHVLEDMTDGNIERLEREERRYQEALWWLERMKYNGMDSV